MIEDKFKNIAQEVYLYHNSNSNDEDFYKNVMDDLKYEYKLSEENQYKIWKYIEENLFNLFDKKSVLGDLLALVRLDEQLNTLEENLQDCEETTKKFKGFLKSCFKKYDLTIDEEFKDNLYEKNLLLHEFLENILIKR